MAFVQQVQEAGSQGAQQNDGHAVWQRDAPALPQVVEKSGDQQVSVLIALMAQSMVHVQRMALVRAGHLFEEREQTGRQQLSCQILFR
jgi:hypothetical protein